MDLSSLGGGVCVCAAQLWGGAEGGQGRLSEPRPWLAFEIEDYGRRGRESEPKFWEGGLVI